MKGPAAMLDGLTISKYNLLAKNSSLSIDKNISVQKREHLSVDKGNIEIFEDVLSTQKMVTSSESAAAVGGFSGCCGLWTRFGSSSPMHYGSIECYVVLLNENNRTVKAWSDWPLCKISALTVTPFMYGSHQVPKFTC